MRVESTLSHFSGGSITDISLSWFHFFEKAVLWVINSLLGPANICNKRGSFLPIHILRATRCTQNLTQQHPDAHTHSIEFMCCCMFHIMFGVIYSWSYLVSPTPCLCECFELYAKLFHETPPWFSMNIACISLWISMLWMSGLGWANTHVPSPDYKTHFPHDTYVYKKTYISNV